MKICPNCKQQKELSCFSIRRKSKYQSWCKECMRLLNRTHVRRKYNHEWRKNHRYDSKGMARIRRNAKQQVIMAVKSSRLTKGVCEECGEPKVEGHHADYNEPLKVKWLCSKHHRAIHNLLTGGK